MHREEKLAANYNGQTSFRSLQSWFFKLLEFGSLVSGGLDNHKTEFFIRRNQNLILFWPHPQKCDIIGWIQITNCRSSLKWKNGDINQNIIGDVNTWSASLEITAEYWLVIVASIVVRTATPEMFWKILKFTALSCCFLILAPFLNNKEDEKWRTRKVHATNRFWTDFWHKSAKVHKNWLSYRHCWQSSFPPLPCDFGSF